MVRGEERFGIGSLRHYCQERRPGPILAKG